MRRSLALLLLLLAPLAQAHDARPNYVQAFLDNLLNWDFVAQNMG